MKPAAPYYEVEVVSSVRWQTEAVALEFSHHTNFRNGVNHVGIEMDTTLIEDHRHRLVVLHVAFVDLPAGPRVGASPPRRWAGLATRARAADITLAPTSAMATEATPMTTASATNDATAVNAVPDPSMPTTAASVPGWEEVRWGA